MLKRIRNTRINLKTGLLILGLALLMWAMVIYVRIEDFVPPEYSEPVEMPLPDP
ncbi:MAG TPA: hypothetical protein VLA36_05390 [Longimicrobiales bacterium]|nr:hypothetical protein [Longimicrobiales bacterium]